MTTFDITDAFLERLVQRGIVCMAWTQVYDPAGSVVLSALSAAIPLMVLFYMLAIRRAKGHVAAIVGLAVAFVLAVALWGILKDSDLASCVLRKSLDKRRLP